MVSTINSNKEYTNRQKVQVDAPETASAIADITQHEAKDLYLDGVAAALKRKRTAAEHLLRASLALDPQNPQAWLWLAGVVEKPEESIQCLEQVLELVPDEPHALEGIAWAKKRQAQEKPAREQFAVLETPPPPIERQRTVPAEPVIRTRVLLQRPWIWGLLVICGLISLCCVVLVAYAATRLFSYSWGNGLVISSQPTLAATGLSIPATENTLQADLAEDRDLPVTLTPAESLFLTPTLSAAPAEFIPPTQSPLSVHLPVVATSPVIILPSPTPESTPEVPPFRPNWYPDVSPLATLRSSNWRIPVRLWNLNKKLTEKAVQHEKRQGKWIDIDISEQTLRAFEDGELVMEVKVSTGPKQAPTVQGEYRILSKYRTIDMFGPGYYVAAVPHAMFFYQGYSIHGAYWHDKFGQPTGHGCVNMRPKEAEKLFVWADPPLSKNTNSVLASESNKGTVVIVHE